MCEKLPSGKNVENQLEIIKARPKSAKNILLTTSSKFELQTRYEPRTRGYSSCVGDKYEMLVTDLTIFVPNIPYLR